MSSSDFAIVCASWCGAHAKYCQSEIEKESVDRVCFWLKRKFKVKNASVRYRNYIAEFAKHSPLSNEQFKGYKSGWIRNLSPLLVNIDTTENTIWLPIGSRFMNSNFNYMLESISLVAKQNQNLKCTYEIIRVPCNYIGNKDCHGPMPIDLKDHNVVGMGKFDLTPKTSKHFKIEKYYNETDLQVDRKKSKYGSYGVLMVMRIKYKLKHDNLNQKEKPILKFEYKDRDLKKTTH
jgi:hypothetical protein